MSSKISKEKCKHKRWSYASKNNVGEGLAECVDCELWMTHSSALQYQNLRYQKTFQKWFNIGTIAVALVAVGVTILVAYVSPRLQRNEETNNEIISLYRNIIANEEIFIANDYREFVKNPVITNLPEPYIDYQISGRAHEILQREFGIINYRYLLYYLSSISRLDELREKLATELVVSGSNSTFFKDLLKMYSQLSIELGESESWEDKFNIIHETGCLLYVFQETFNFIVVDERDETVACRDTSLNRIFYHFGYLPGNAPDWLEEELRSSVKRERDIDI